MHTNLTFLETRIIDLHFPWYHGSIFLKFISGGLVGSVKRFFSAKSAFWPFKVTQVHWFSTNQKRVCDFLISPHNLAWFYFAPSQRYCRFSCSSSHSYLGVFPLDQITHVGVSLKLISSEIIFEAFQPMWSWYLNVADGQTDRLMRHNCALRA